MDYKLFQEHRETKYGIHLVEETSLDTLVYSIVYLNDTGKVIVAIAMNPRGNKPISEEENRINNANSQNVTKLEPTRRTALYRFSDLFGYKSFKELIQVDIFSKRTIQSKQLDYEIRNAVDRTELDRLIGFNNYETIKAEVEKADYALLDWGAGIPWEKFSDYRDELYQLFENNFEKCFWFGATSAGSPKHPNFHGEKRLQKIEKSELKRIFYKK